MILLLAYYTTRMVLPISVHLPSSVSSPMLAKQHLFLFHKRNIIKCMKKDLHGCSSMMAGDEGMTPRSSMFAYLIPAKEEARSKDTRSPQGPALRLGVEGKNYL
jgi:hypothetical protein